MFEGFGHVSVDTTGIAGQESVRTFEIRIEANRDTHGLGGPLIPLHAKQSQTEHIVRHGVLIQATDRLQGRGNTLPHASLTQTGPGDTEQRMRIAWIDVQRAPKGLLRFAPIVQGKQCFSDLNM
jgi:hypothetical protein